MKKALIFPIVYGLALASFGTYSILDTLLIKKVKKAGISFNFSEDEPSSSKPKSSGQSSKNSDSNINSSSTGSNPNSSTASSNSSQTEDIFSDTVVQTDNFYVDKNLRIEISTEVVKTQHLKQNKLMDTTVYCADVHIRTLKHLRTAFSHDKYGDNLTEWTSKNARRQGAIFAINGDTYGAQEAGYVLRNEQLFREKARKNAEDLVMYYDGTFETFYEKDYTLAQIANKYGEDNKAWQVWSFGPALVKNGAVAVDSDTEVDTFSQYGNQRVSIGIIEPFHYICAVCDGRLDDSYGMKLIEMAEYMVSKGCKVAYNLDGGGSSAFFFNDQLMNRPCTNPNQVKERGVSDIVYFA